MALPETITINGREYARWSNQRFWQAKPDGTVPGIVCECGNDLFRLSNCGEYNTTATCSACGISETVHDG